MRCLPTKRKKIKKKRMEKSGGDPLMEATGNAIAVTTAFASSGVAICLASISLMCVYKIWKRYRSAIISTSEQTPNTSVIIEMIQTEQTIDSTPNTEMDMCYICTERRASTILLNCRHQGVCLDCTKTLLRSKQSCPLCRGDLVGMIHLMSSGETMPME